jgi:hypothetical protein
MALDQSGGTGAKLGSEVECQRFRAWVMSRRATFLGFRDVQSRMSSGELWTTRVRANLPTSSIPNFSQLAPPSGKIGAGPDIPHDRTTRPSGVRSRVISKSDPAMQGRANELDVAFERRSS